MVYGGVRRRLERWRVVRGGGDHTSRVWRVETVPSGLSVAVCEARVDAQLLVREHNWEVGRRRNGQAWHRLFRLFPDAEANRILAEQYRAWKEKRAQVTSALVAC